MLTRLPQQLCTEVTVAEHGQLQTLKQDVKNKKGLLSEHHYLSFNSFVAESLSFVHKTQWQGILFRNQRAIGKLCSPTVSLSTLEDRERSRSSIRRCSIAFDTWVPSGTSSSAHPLRLSVHPQLQDSEISVKVFGIQQGSFALPQKFSICGRNLCAKLEIELQRLQYIERHKAAANTSVSSGSGVADKTVAIEIGNEVEGVITLVDVNNEPFLKSLICNFLVAESFSEASKAGVLGSFVSYAERPLPALSGKGPMDNSIEARSPPQQKQPTRSKQHHWRAREAFKDVKRGVAQNERASDVQDLTVDSPVPGRSSHPGAEPTSAQISPPRKGKRYRRSKSKMGREQADTNSLPKAGFLAEGSKRHAQQSLKQSPRGDERPEEEAPLPSSAAWVGPVQRQRRGASTGRTQERDVEHNRSSQRKPAGQHWGSWADQGVPGRSDAPGRWRQLATPAKELLAVRTHVRLPVPTGTSSDVSSEALSSPGSPSSLSNLHSCLASPGAESSSVAMRPAAVEYKRPSSLLLDTPAALRALTEALLPHQAAPATRELSDVGNVELSSSSSSSPSSARAKGGLMAASVPRQISRASTQHHSATSTLYSSPSSSPAGCDTMSSSDNMEDYHSGVDFASPTARSCAVELSKGGFQGSASTLAPRCPQEELLAGAASHGQQCTRTSWSPQPSRLKLRHACDTPAGPSLAHCKGTAERNARGSSDTTTWVAEASSQHVGKAAVRAADMRAPPADQDVTSSACAHDSKAVQGDALVHSAAVQQPPQQARVGSTAQSQSLPLRPGPGQQGSSGLAVGHWHKGSQQRRHHHHQPHQQQYPTSHRQSYHHHQQQQQQLWQAGAPYYSQPSDTYSSGYESSWSSHPHMYWVAAPPALRPLASVRQGHTSSAPASRCGSLAASPTVSRRVAGADHRSPPPLRQLGVLSEPVQLQVLDGVEDGPDLERLMEAFTPEVAPAAGDPADLTLGDVWRFFWEPSLFGKEVVTLGGPGGPAASFYLPYLSAVELYAPVRQQGSQQAGHPGGGEGLFRYPSGLEDWPAEMRLQYSWAASGHVGQRIPLGPQLEELAGKEGESHPLYATRVLDLHPYSWFAVAWYPLYRIPEASLDARFLTYHSLASLWQLAKDAAEGAARHGTATPVAVACDEGTNEQPPGAAPCSCTSLPSPFACRDPQLGPSPRLAAISISTPTGVCSFPGSPSCSDAGTRTTNGGSRGANNVLRSDFDSSGSGRSTGGVSSSFTPSPSPAASECSDSPSTPHACCPVKLPVVGLQWYTMPRSRENWTDTLVAAQLPEGVDAVPGARLADGSTIMGCWRGVAVVAKPYPAAKGGNFAWEVRLEELGETASRLATGRGLVSLAPGGAAHSAHPDHGFFCSRAWTCRASGATATLAGGRTYPDLS